MKQVSADYKAEIKKHGREIDAIITYYNHYKMITEDEHYILTENGIKINTEHINSTSYIEIGASDIFDVTLKRYGSLLSTMMKCLEFQVRQDMNIGSIINFKFGVKVNNDYEYIDYGNFIVNEKSYNEDTHLFSYKAYDMMLKSMIPYKDTTTYPTTLYGLLNDVLDYCKIEIGITEFPNSERNIYDNPFQNIDITCRDVLDLITQVTGSSSFIENEQFVIKGPEETNEVLYANSFKDTNVKFSKVYGPINSILFSRSEDLDIVEYKDETSIEQNGITQIKIKDNPLLEDNNRSDYFEEMYGAIGGLTYTINDLDSTGITYLDIMDLFKVQIENNEYQCLLLNDEIKISQGLEEKLFTEELEETTQEYRTSRMNDRDQKWANIQVKKDVAEISLEVGSKVGKNEVISAINLSPESATIQSSKINLQGYVTVSDLSGSGTTTINGSNITTGSISANRVTGGTLTGTTISGNTITNGNGFSVNTSGSITSTSGTIGGWTITNQDLYNSVSGMSSNTGKYAFWAGESNGVHGASNTDATFKVGHNGYLYATNASISGAITATSGSFTGAIYSSSGTIAGWSINAGSLSATSGGYSVWLSPAYLSAKAPGDTVEDVRWYEIVDVIAGIVSDRKAKENITSIEDKYEDFFDKLNPSLFKYKEEYDRYERKKGKTHIGFIAQDILESQKESDINNLSIVSEGNILKIDKQEIIALNTWQIQKLKKEVQELKEQIEELKKKVK